MSGSPTSMNLYQDWRLEDDTFTHCNQCDGLWPEETQDAA